jgi:hypothetical protein
MATAPAKKAVKYVVEVKAFAKAEIREIREV